MEKIIIRFSRTFFWSLLAVLIAFVAVAECVYLLNYQSKDQLTLSNLSKTESLKVAAQSGEEEKIMEIKSEIKESDARPIIIEKYLAKYKSPLLPYARQIFEISETYGFEYYWIVAIAQQESNLCKKIPQDSHNCWGYGIHKSGTLKFENYDLAIKAYAEYLKREYFDKGLNTPELIMKKYCPHSDGSWAQGVQQFIEEMERGV
jgi:hypothetical protein